jgi:hypothetical protein
VGGVRGEATQDNIVFETKLQGFEGLVRPETVGEWKEEVIAACLIVKAGCLGVII